MESRILGANRRLLCVPSTSRRSGLPDFVSSFIADLRRNGLDQIGQQSSPATLPAQPGTHLRLPKALLCFHPRIAGQIPIQREVAAHYSNSGFLFGGHRRSCLCFRENASHSIEAILLLAGRDM